MREYDRVRAGQEVGGDEFVGRCPTLVRPQAGEPDGVGERGLVAEHRRGFRKVCVAGSSRDSRRVIWRRTESGVVPRGFAGPDCVRDGHHEVRVSSRLRKDGFRQVRVDVAVGKRIGKQRVHRGLAEVGRTDRWPTRRIR